MIPNKCWVLYLAYLVLWSVGEECNVSFFSSIRHKLALEGASEPDFFWAQSVMLFWQLTSFCSKLFFLLRVSNSNKRMLFNSWIIDPLLSDARVNSSSINDVKENTLARAYSSRTWRGSVEDFLLNESNERKLETDSFVELLIETPIHKSWEPPFPDQMWRAHHSPREWSQGLSHPNGRHSTCQEEGAPLYSSPGALQNAYSGCMKTIHQWEDW